MKNPFYKRMLVKALYFDNEMSCLDLSTRIDKSLPLTTRVLNELVNEGVVVETGYAPSSGGRRPLLYSLKKNVMYTVSVAMDQFVTRIAIMDLQNNFEYGVEKLELPLSRKTQIVPILSDTIKDVIARSGIDTTKIAGIGIGMPGFVDAKQGVNYTFFETGGENIATAISRETGLPVFIDNDSSLIALAELRFGAARNKKDTMVINIGWGIGLGLVLNGSLFRGHDGFAGEFSHIPIFSNGKLCGCGKSGCLETETSLCVVVEKAIEGLKNGTVSMLNKDLLETDHPDLNCEAIMAAARKGDQFVVKLLSEAAYNIGRGVAILVHILNPELVILSGRGSMAGKLWQAPIQQALNEHCIPRLATNTSIVVSSLGYEAELIGAAALVMENYEKRPGEKREKVKKKNVIAYR